MNNQNLIAFAFDERAVRVLPTNSGSFQVVAKDVADALGYNWNGAQRIAHVPEEWRGVTSVVTPSGDQEMLILTEEGLYFFLARSDKPKARPFQMWLAGEVLPSIRKNGHYGRGPTVSQQLSAHGVLIRLSDKLEAERHPLKRELLKGQIDHACRILGLAVPDLDAIGHTEKPAHEDQRLAEFWEAVDLLVPAADGERLNHARGAGLLALNLPQFRSVAASARLNLPEMYDLRQLLRHSRSPRFVGIKAVNSRHTGGTIKCWVFERDEEIGEEV